MHITSYERSMHMHILLLASRVVVYKNMSYSSYELVVCILVEYICMHKVQLSCMYES